MNYNVIIVLFVVLAFTFLNRLRGGGFFKTPIDSKLFVAPFVVALAWLVGVHSILSLKVEFQPYLDALLFGLGWLFWAYLPWSEWMTLGNTGPSQRAPTWFETVINKASFGNPYLALWLRMFIGLIPIVVLFGWAWFALSVMLLASYGMGWSIRNDIIKSADPIAISELISGACWGILLGLQIL